MMSEAPNLEKLREAMQKSFNKSPLQFFQRVVAPLIPKTSLLAVQTDNGARAAIKIIAGIDGDAL